MKAKTGYGDMNVMEKETQPTDMDCQSGSGVESQYERHWRIKG